MSCKPIVTPIIKPIDGLCNLSCQYCYTYGLKKDAPKKCMEKEVLKEVIDFFCCDQKNVEFIWHGGEPLLAGLDFYRNVVEVQSRWKNQGKNVSNFIQTNGTLVTEEWTRFFLEYGFFVGVSIDGPKEFHDQTRRHSTNRGSYEKVMRGIGLLRKSDVFNGVICCISTVNYKFPREIFNFFISNGIKKLKFTRVKNTGECKDVSSISISPEQYTDFMIAIFDLWLEMDDQEIEIRNIQSVVNVLLGGSRRECIYMGQCDKFVTVYHDGSIYSCDSFPREGGLFFGNVFGGIDIFRSNSNMKRFHDLLEIRKDRCKACGWYSVCRGGCARDNYARLDSVEPLVDVCESLKRYFEHISGKLKSYGL